MSATLSIRPRLVNTIDRPLYGSIFCAHFDFIMGTLGRLFPAYWYNNWYNAVVRIKEGTAPTPCGRMARPPGLEPGTLCLEGRCSIQLSYGRIKPENKAFCNISAIALLTFLYSFS